MEIVLFDTCQGIPSCSDKEGQGEASALTEGGSFPLPVPYHRKQTLLSPRTLNKLMITHIKSYNAETGRVLSSDEAGRWGKDEGQFLENAVKVAQLFTR